MHREKITLVWAVPFPLMNGVQESAPILYMYLIDGPITEGIRQVYLIKYTEWIYSE